MNKHPTILMTLEYPEGCTRQAIFLLDDNDYSSCSRQQVINEAHCFASRPFSQHCGIMEATILTDNVISMAEWNGNSRLQAMTNAKNKAVEALKEMMDTIIALTPSEHDLVPGSIEEWSKLIAELEKA